MKAKSVLCSYLLSTKKFLLLSIVFLLAGCSKEEIKVYSVPKEVAASNHSPVHWTTPKGWKELAPTDLRAGNFLVTVGDKKAEVSIIPFPGKVGTELQNVNRWRNEIGLPPITGSELASEKVSVGPAEAKLYDVSGGEFQTLAAILEKEGTSWFFKIRGDREIVAQNKPTFVEFLKSISFDGDRQVEAPVATKPVSTNTKKVPDLAAAANPNEPQWEIPPRWQEKAPSAMVLKSFSVGGEEHEARISITAFPGDVGGTLANVNRWRNQLSLEPVAESELSKLTTPIDVLGGKGTLVEMNGTDGKTGKPARMIAAMVPRKEKTWFYKLMGDEATVSREKDAFVKFVQTVRYPND